MTLFILGTILGLIIGGIIGINFPNFFEEPYKLIKKFIIWIASKIKKDKDKD